MKGGIEMNFKYNLRNLRATKGWTQSELADKTGLSKSIVSDYEVGRSKPDVNTLIKLAEVFGVSIDQLVGHKVSENDLFLFALYEETKDLTEAQKKDILDMVKIMRRTTDSTKKES